MLIQTNSNRVEKGDLLLPDNANPQAVAVFSRREVVKVSVASLLLWGMGSFGSSSVGATVLSAGHKGPKSTHPLDAAVAPSIERGRITLNLRVMPARLYAQASIAISVSVDSPMTEDDYVETLIILAEQHPDPDVASFRFSPALSSASGTASVNLEKSQNIVAVAKMNDGSLFTGSRYVDIT